MIIKSYPPETPLTDEILDEYGFSEYHDSSGDYGYRRLWEVVDGNHHVIFTVHDMDDTTDYFTGEPIAHHFCDESFTEIKTVGELYDEFKAKHGISLVEYLVLKKV